MLLHEAAHYVCYQLRYKEEKTVYVLVLFIRTAFLGYRLMMHQNNQRFYEFHVKKQPQISINLDLWRFFLLTAPADAICKSVKNFERIAMTYYQQLNIARSRSGHIEKEAIFYERKIFEDPRGYRICPYHTRIFARSFGLRTAQRSHTVFYAIITCRGHTICRCHRYSYHCNYEKMI